MPFDEVMSKFKSGSLPSGSKSGPKVANPKQAVAIMLSEKAKAAAGDTEYAPLKGLKGAKPKKSAPKPPFDPQNLK